MLLHLFCLFSTSSFSLVSLGAVVCRVVYPFVHSVLLANVDCIIRSGSSSRHLASGTPSFMPESRESRDGVARPPRSPLPMHLHKVSLLYCSTGLKRGSFVPGTRQQVRDKRPQFTVQGIFKGEKLQARSYMLWHYWIG